MFMCHRILDMYLFIIINLYLSKISLWFWWYEKLKINDYLLNWGTASKFKLILLVIAINFFCAIGNFLKIYCGLRESSHVNEKLKTFVWTLAKSTSKSNKMTYVKLYWIVTKPPNPNWVPAVHNFTATLPGWFAFKSEKLLIMWRVIFLDISTMENVIEADYTVRSD